MNQSEYLVLRSLLAEQADNAQVKAADIAAHLGQAPSAVSRTVKQLVQKGWVDRQSDPADRRQVQLTLTAQGHQEYQRATERVESFLVDLVGDLTEAELESYIHLTAKIYQTMERLLNESPPGSTAGQYTIEE